MSQIIQINGENFEREVIQASETVLLDFWAPWCGPCRLVTPILEELAAEKAGMVKIAKLNVDENHPIAIKFRITSIPTFMVFRDGLLVERLSGAMPKTSFEALIDRNLLMPIPA